MAADKRNGRGRGDPIAALDVGSSKIACFLAQIEPDGRPRVIGVGHLPSRGVRAGAVIDLEQARESILDAVQAGERMAGQTLRKVFVSLGGGKPATERLSCAIEIEGQEIGPAEIRKVLALSRERAVPAGRELLHAMPLGFRVDGQRGIRDPRGMFGRTLGLEVNSVTAESGPLRTLASCIAGGHLDVTAFVVAPYAAALATLVEDEMAMGAVVIDMGGGTTGVAVFEAGALAFADTVPVGGTHVTQDIAHGLSTPLAQAERLKIQFGSALPRPGDDREIVDVPQIGGAEGGANHMPKSLLTGIVKPRLEETLELVRGKLEQSGVSKPAARRIVLTGGASQLAGAAELAGSILDRQVRCGRPRRLHGLAEAAAGPAFATAAGLVIYALERHGHGGLPLAQEFVAPIRPRRSRRLPSSASPLPAARTSVLRRLGTWLHDHF